MERQDFAGQPYWNGKFDDLSYIFPYEERTDSADKVDVLLLDFDLETRQSMMEEAYNEMLRQLDKHKWRDEWESVIQQCMPTYERKFERRQKERAHEVVNQDEVINAIEAYDKTATKVNGYLSAWFRLALNDAIALSDPIAALVTGQLRFPLWDDTSDEALGDSLGTARLASSGAT